MSLLKAIFKKFKAFDEVKKNGLPDCVLRDVNPNTLWKTVSELGDGAYGKVYKVTRISDSLEAALKTIKYDSEDELSDFMVEIQILTNTKHNNILVMYEAYIFEKSLWLFLELCGGGALDSIMNTLERPLSEPQIQFVAHEMLQGLDFLHGNLFIHRDVKAGNVLITASGEIKLADFGASAKLAHDKQKRDTFIGTPYWMAPEVINCETPKATPYNHLSDVWSFGITLIELSQMRPPHHTANPNRVLFKITQGDPPTLKIPQLWSKGFNQFLSRCLRKDPVQRPECKELLHDPFVSNVCEDDRRHIRLLLGELKADVEDCVEEISIDSSEHPDDVAGLVAPLDDMVSVEEEEDEGHNSDASGGGSDVAGVNGNGATGLPDQLVTPDSAVAAPNLPVEKVSLDAAVHGFTEYLINNVITSETHHPSIPSCVFEVMRELSQAADVPPTAQDTSSLSTVVPTNLATGDSVKSSEEENGLSEAVASLAANGLPPPSTASTLVTTPSPPTTSSASDMTSMVRRNTTVTKTRRFVLDGEEIVTKTRQVIPTLPDTLHPSGDDFRKRKADLRAVRLINKQEIGHIRQLTSLANQTKDQLESKLSAETMALQRKYELKLESACRHCRINVEILEKKHEIDLKRIRAEATSREQAFKRSLKSEIRGQTSQANWKAAMRELRECLQSSQHSGAAAAGATIGDPSISSGSSMASVNSSNSASSLPSNASVVFSIAPRLEQFRKDENLWLQQSLKQSSCSFSAQCAKHFQNELMEKQTLRNEFEQNKGRIEQRHLNARYQLDRAEMQDFFVIKRNKLSRLFDMDLAELRHVTITERELLALNHALARRLFSKNAKSANRKSLPAFYQWKKKSREMVERLRREKISERERLEERLLQQAEALEQRILLRSRELEQSHSRQLNEMVDFERECLEELEKRHADELKTHNEALSHTLKMLRDRFTREVEDLSDLKLPLQPSDSSRYQPSRSLLHSRASSLVNLASKTR